VLAAEDLSYCPFARSWCQGDAVARNELARHASDRRGAAGRLVLSLRSTERSLGDGIVEFASVNLHDDFTTPE